MDIFSLLSPEQWILTVLLIIGAICSILCFHSKNKRLSDRVILAVFFVYAIYGIVRYAILFYLHWIHGSIIPREHTLMLNTLSQIREMYLVFAMLIIILKGNFGFFKPSFTRRGIKYGDTK
ncbi:MAG TPA: hypothetical protein VMX17_13390 [Candidatus Glassbacteria bacterium]|nr:hypothetical protein [Candidatus Glassbacteria bacterium]